MSSLYGKAILLVDDEKDICDIIAAELLVSGANPVKAHDVQSALKMLDERKIDLVISDIRMPGTSGVELLDILRKRHVKTPVILITGFADISEEAALAKGAYQIISKPFDLDELMSSAASALKT